MAQQLSVNAELLLQQIGKEPQIIIEIEGVPLFFGARPVLEFTKWDADEVRYDEGFFWDGASESEKSRDYISLNGTTNNISQQIYPDKEGASSVSTANIALIDKNGEMSKVFSFDNIGDVLGKKATFYYGFAQGTHPNDSVPLLYGVITDFYNSAGQVNLTIAHPDTLKTQSVFATYSTELNGNIDNVQTNIPVIDSTDNFLPSTDILTSYIRIEDEIMEVTNVNANSFDVVRGAFATIAVSHDDDTEVNSGYQLVALPIPMALKLMHSDGQQSFTEYDVIVKQFIDNSVVFDNFNIERSTGLVVGDSITLNGYGTFTVSGFSTNEDTDESSIVVTEPLNDLADPTTTLSIRSQYNVLPDGLGMKPFEIDTETFLGIESLFSTSFVEMDFYLDETLDNCKEFIDKELYFVPNMYGIPRNGRSSVKYLSPPLSAEILPTLDANTITNITKLNVRRSTYKNLYNSVLYKFNKSRLEDRFLSTRQTIDGDSVNRIKIGKKILPIESSGLRRNAETNAFVALNSSRFLDRYKFASTYIDSVKTSLKTGLKIDVGDVVLFGGENTQLTDFQTGERNLPLKKYEVTNKKFNIKTGEQIISILDSGFSVEGTFAVFSPASYVSTGSTTTNVVLKKGLFDFGDIEYETDKWVNFIGAKLRVRDEEYSVLDETVTFMGVDPQNPSAIIVSPALSIAPTDNMVVEFANYDDQGNADTSEIGRQAKITYTFTMDQAELTSVADASNFDVDDTTGLFIGQKIQVHSDDYTRDTQEVLIDNIVGNTITTNEPLNVLPLIGDKLGAYSFSDLDGYRFL